MKYSNVAATVALLSAAGAYALTKDEFMKMTETKDNKLVLKADALAKVDEGLHANIKGLINPEGKLVEGEALTKALEDITKAESKLRFTKVSDFVGDKKADDFKDITAEKLTEIGMSKEQFADYVSREAKDRNQETYDKIMAYDHTIMGHFKRNMIFYIVGGVVVVGAAVGGIYYMKKGDSEETDL